MFSVTRRKVKIDAMYSFPSTFRGIWRSIYGLWFQLHCKHCGRIFCSSCLTHTVHSGPNSRPSKVCDVCHTLLVRDSAPYFSTVPPQGNWWVPGAQACLIWVSFQKYSIQKSSCKPIYELRRYSLFCSFTEYLPVIIKKLSFYAECVFYLVLQFSS